MTMHPDQRKAIGEANIKVCEQAGYVWQLALPGHFWHPATGDEINYFTARDASFGELKARIARGKP